MLLAANHISKPGLVVTTAVERAAAVVLIVRVAVFGLAPLVYFEQAFHTTGGGLFAAVMFAWAAWRLATRNPAKSLIVADLAFVLAAALLAPFLVAPDITDPSMSFTRVVAYPTVVALAISEPRRWSFVSMVAVFAATVAGDVLAFGSPSATAFFMIVNWAGAACVRVLIVRAAQATDRAAEDFRRARLQDDVATARVRFEREQLAALHDTAASTLMMVGDGLGDPANVAAQARQDVEILTESPISDDPDHLVDHLNAASRESRVPVALSGSAVVPLQLARTIGAATREVLNNVRRHAGATEVVISLTANSVVITDDGVGFDTRKHRAGFGLRGSIEGRMRSAGGRAEVTSERGTGTCVRLTWPPVDTVPEAAPTDARHLLRSYQFGLAAGQAAVALQLFATGRLFADGRVLEFSVFALCLLVAASPIVVAFACGRARHARMVVVAAVVILCQTFVFVLPEDLLISPANWAAVAGGWSLAALLSGWVTSGRRVRVACLIVIANWVAVATVTISRLPIGSAVSFVGYGLASLAVMQCSAICLAWVLAQSVQDADRIGEQLHALDAQAAVRTAIEREGRDNFAKLNAGTVGLLRGLADRSLSPDDPEVRHRARIEYDRIRRLFTQRGPFEHPLLERLRPGLDAAGERGVTVEFEVSAKPVAVAELAVEPVISAIVAMLECARKAVRLVVSTSGDQTTLSVLADCAEADLDLSRRLSGADFDIRRQGELMWLRVRLTAAVV